MKNTITFDYIISNPPYVIGNIITKSVIDNTQFDHFINLMPIAGYRNRELYKKVKTLSVVDASFFTDAAVADNLCICELTKIDINTFTYNTLELETFEDIFKKYYFENLKRDKSWIWSTIQDEKMLNDLLKEGKTFFLTIRTIMDGVHKTESAYDIQANKHNKIVTNCLDQVTFKTTAEKINIQNWWYSSEISSRLCKATRKQGGGGTHPIFLPKVDWTRPWTDSEILEDYGYTKEEIEEILNETN